MTSCDLQHQLMLILLLFVSILCRSGGVTGQALRGDLLRFATQIVADIAIICSVARIRHHTTNHPFQVLNGPLTCVWLQVHLVPIWGVIGQVLRVVGCDLQHQLVLILLGFVHFVPVWGVTCQALRGDLLRFATPVGADIARICAFCAGLGGDWSVFER